MAYYFILTFYLSVASYVHWQFAIPLYALSVSFAHVLFRLFVFFISVWGSSWHISRINLLSVKRGINIELLNNRALFVWGFFLVG